MANRYWVGGTANWDGTAGSKWATTSGGAGGAAVPTSSDDVFFDAASGAVTVTINATANCLSFNCTGFTGTWAGSSALNVFGNFTLAMGMIRTYSGTLTFSSTSTGRTITMAGKTLGALTFNGSGGGWAFQDTFANGTSAITLTTGALDTNNQTVNIGRLLATGSGVRGLSLGSSTITVETDIQINATNLTFNSGTSTIVFPNSGSFQPAGLTWYNVNYTGNDGGSPNISQSGTFNNLSVVPAGGGRTWNASGSITLTVNGTFTATGASATNRVRIKAGTGAAFASTTPVTINAANVSLTNVDFMDVTAGGAATWSGTSIGNGLGNSNITFTTPVTRYWVGNGGNWNDTARWAATSGGSSGATVPLCHDTVIFDANSFSSGGQSVSNFTTWLAASINCSAVTNSPTINFSGFIFGALTLQSGITASSSSINFWARSTTNITTAGVTLGSVTFSNTGTWSFQDSLACSSIVANAGTFNLNNFNITCSTVSASAAAIVKTWNLGSSTITLTGTGTVWDPQSNAVIVPGTSTFIINNNSASSKTFNSRGLLYNIIQWTSGSTGTLTVSGNCVINQFYLTGTGTGNCDITGSPLTIHELKIDTPPHTVRFGPSCNVYIQKYTVTGTAGNLNVIKCTTDGGTPTTLLKPAGVVSVDYVSIRDMTASGGAKYFAGVNSTNVSGNTGWIFTAPTTTNEAVTGGFFRL